MDKVFLSVVLQEADVYAVQNYKIQREHRRQNVENILKDMKQNIEFFKAAFD